MNTEPPLYLLASWRLRCLWKDWFIGVLLTWAIKKEQRGEQGHAMLPNHSRGESINDTGSDASRQQQPKSHIQHGDIMQNDANIGTSLWIIGFFGGCWWLALRTVSATCHPLRRPDGQQRTGMECQMPLQKPWFQYLHRERSYYLALSHTEMVSTLSETWIERRDCELKQWLQTIFDLWPNNWNQWSTCDTSSQI